MLKDFKNNQEYLKEGSILLAFSAGVDSVTLASLLHNFECDFQLAYFNHMIRGNDEINKDIQIVENLSREYSIPFHIGQSNIPEYATTHKLSLEDAARRVRYEYLTTTAKENNLKYIATAHHRDDNLETVLMKFLRGSGLKGLSGIEKELTLDTVRVIRPLLSFSKKDIEEYATKNKLQFNQDLTNFDSKIFRNKLRNEVIPDLQKLNSNLSETIERTANIIKEDNDYLESQTTKVYKNILLKPPYKNSIKIDTSSLSHYHKSIQRRVVRMAIEKLQGNLLDISVGYIDNFLDNDCNVIYLNEDDNIEVKKE